MGGWVRSVAGQADILARCVARGRGQWPVWAPWRRGLATTCPTHTGGAWITATPRVCLHDVPTTLRAGGLPPNAPVTLSALIVDENGKQFCSHAYYTSDAKGGVDVGVAASVGGAYTGVFPEGLLSTLAPAPHEHPALRLYRRHTHTPWKVRVTVSEGHQPLEARTEAVAEVELERHLMAPGVRRVPVREGRVRGALYLPPGDGPFPGIVDMFGSVGGLMEFRSAMLASRGLASLALAVFAYDDLPTTTDNLDMEYFEEAVQLLLAQPQVIPDRCGAVGVSKSGDIVFTMGTLFPSVKAVVGISSCTMAMSSRLTYKGQLYKQGINPPVEMMQMNEHGAYSLDFSFLFDNDNPAMIPVEEADDETHFLVVAGEDDAFGFGKSLAVFRERMLHHNRSNFQTVLYPGTGHMIEPPYGPLIQQSFQRHFPDHDQHKRFSKGLMMNWGGQAQFTCKAQVDLWWRMRNFFMQHLRDESPWYQDYLSNYSNRLLE
nr:acyl-coenzyme A thioesterase 5-like isoform X2 [Procambarus clarkii]